MGGTGGSVIVIGIPPASPCGMSAPPGDISAAIAAGASARNAIDTEAKSLVKNLIDALPAKQIPPEQLFRGNPQYHSLNRPARAVSERSGRSDEAMLNVAA